MAPWWACEPSQLHKWASVAVSRIRIRLFTGSGPGSGFLLWSGSGPGIIVIRIRMTGAYSEIFSWSRPCFCTIPSRIRGQLKIRPLLRPSKFQPCPPEETDSALKVLNNSSIFFFFCAPFWPSSNRIRLPNWNRIWSGSGSETLKTRKNIFTKLCSFYSCFLLCGSCRTQPGAPSTGDRTVSHGISCR